MILFYEEYGIMGAAIGILIGSVGRLSVHLTKLLRKINIRKIKLEDQYKRRIWLLTWPLLIGVGFSQIGVLVDNIFASFLQEGAIAALSYSKKIVELPVVVFPYVLSVVVFPYFSQLSIAKEHERLRNLLADSLKWIVIFFLPIAAYFYVFSPQITEIIFQRGAFNAHSTLLTSKPLAVYSLGMVFFAIETILVIFYYANADTKTPIFIGIGCVILNIILTYIFIQYIGYIGIALAYVMQKAVKNIILLILVERKISYEKRELFYFIAKMAFSTIVFILIIFLIKNFLYDKFTSGVILKMYFLASAFAIGGSVYATLLYVFKMLRIGKQR
jgi:murein biosynthesis integral membrane protein MurJ